MGFWKDVWYDMSRGMSKEDAIKLNADLRDPNLTKEEKSKIEAIAEANLKLDNMP